MNNNTFASRGKDGTQLGLTCGDEHQALPLNLYGYPPADRVPHLRNYVLDPMGALPAAVGIDFGASAGISLFSGMSGLHILWHTRGEGNRANILKVHKYQGYGRPFTVGAIFKPMASLPNGAVAVQLMLAWVRRHDGSRVSREL